MAIGKLTLELEIPHAQSLKDRRQVVRAVKDKLRNSFNLSIAELDNAHNWNRAILGAVAISNSISYLMGQMQLIEKAAYRIATGLGGEIVDAYVEILSEEDSSV